MSSSGALREREREREVECGGGGGEIVCEGARGEGI